MYFYFTLTHLVGWGLKSPTQIEGFGESPQGTGAKTQILHLIRSIRTVMKCKCLHVLNINFTNLNPSINLLYTNIFLPSTSNLIY